MPKGRAWTYTEKEIIVKAFNESDVVPTSKQLMELLPGRTEKAISRVIEKLREKGLVGYKNLYELKLTSHRILEEQRKKEGIHDDDWGKSEWK